MFGSMQEYGSYAQTRHKNAHMLDFMFALQQVIPTSNCNKMHLCISLNDRHFLYPLQLQQLLVYGYSMQEQLEHEISQKSSK